jgi:hypothetical protein
LPRVYHIIPEQRRENDQAVCLLSEDLFSAIVFAETAKKKETEKYTSGGLNGL